MKPCQTVIRRLRNSSPHIDMSRIEFMISNHLRSPNCIMGVSTDGTILLNPNVPKSLYTFIEENIDAILLHENLHQAILALEGWYATGAFDTLFHDDRDIKAAFSREILQT